MNPIKQLLNNLEYNKFNIELLKKKEKEAKESVEKEIKDIKLSDIQELLSILNNRTLCFVDDEYINYTYVFLYHKLKFLCFEKGVPVCFLINSDRSFNFVYNIDCDECFKKLKIVNIHELVNFIYQKLFRLGDSNIKYLKDENDFIQKCSNFMCYFNTNIIKQPMTKPKTDLEKLYVLYMTFINTEWNKENYYKFIELYKQLKPKFDKFTNDFCDIIIKHAQQYQKENLVLLYRNKSIEYEKIPLKEKSFFKENDIIKSDDKNNIFIENIDNDLIKKHICSLLNSEGGRIYIGISEDKQVLGIDFDNSKEKDEINQTLNNLVKDFYPSIRKGEIKIIFIPFKDIKDNFIKGLYVIKIIVPQGNVNELYSIEQKKFESYIWEDGETKKFDCDMIEKEMIKRFKKEKKSIDNSIYNDIEPEQPSFPELNKNVIDNI